MISVDVFVHEHHCYILSTVFSTIYIHFIIHMYWAIIWCIVCISIFRCPLASIGAVRTTNHVHLLCCTHISTTPDRYKRLQVHIVLYLLVKSSQSAIHVATGAGYMTQQSESGKIVVSNQQSLMDSVLLSFPIWWSDDKQNFSNHSWPTNIISKAKIFWILVVALSVPIWLLRRHLWPLLVIISIGIGIILCEFRSKIINWNCNANIGFEITLCKYTINQFDSWTCINMC